jgi:2',3'-cyclic-nucleotide 2'-phosphodiesterase (5'-nucleotidase family)
VDLGDFMSTKKLEAERTNEFIFGIMEELGTAVATLGERELTNWSTTRRFLERGRIPYVTTNLSLVEDGVARPLAHRYLVRTVHGVRVGFLGVIGSTEFSSARLPEDLQVTFQEPTDAIQAVLPEVRKEAEVVVLLAHMDGRGTEELVSRIQGIDVALVGHRAKSNKTPELLAGVVVNQSGIRGQWAGITRLIVSPEGEILDWGGKNIPLDAKVDANPDIQKRVEELQAELKVLRQEAAKARRQAAEEKIHLSRYLGVQNCQKCHVDEFHQWQTTAHAKAFKTLQEKGKDKDPACVRCHVTGSGDPTGYRAELTDPDLRNVQCEACHGKGTEHARGEEAAKVVEATCLTCHDEANSPDFDFESYLRQVVHR